MIQSFRSSLNIFILSVITFPVLLSSMQAQVLPWEFEDLLTDQRLSGAQPNVILDPIGNIHATYWDQIRDQLVYLHRDRLSGQVSYTYVDSTQNAGCRSALTLDDSGDVHIAYYQNELGNATIHYASNRGGNWVTEEVIPGTTLGPYGPDLSIDTYRELSVDIEMDMDGEPLISFFNGNILQLKNCGNRLAPFTFTLSLMIGKRSGPGLWQTSTLDQPMNYTPNCVNPNIGKDRFGEFCSLMPLPADSSFLIITNSLYNHKMVAFRSAPNDLNQWQSMDIDSAHRTINPNILIFDEGFAFSDALITEGSDVHSVYALCQSYGQRSAVGGGRPALRNFFYTHFALDSLGQPGYQAYHYEFILPPRDNHFRTFFSITGASSDSLFIAYYDATSLDLALTYTNNGGQTWRQDTVMRGFNTNSKLALEKFQDSLFLISYDARADQLILSRKHIGNNNWSHLNLSPSEKRATYMGSAVEVGQPGQNRIHLAYDEHVLDELKYALKDGSNWQFQTIDDSGDRLKDIDLQLDDQQQAFIAYVWEDQHSLNLARQDGNQWLLETVTTNGAAEYPQLAILADSVHIVYYDRIDQSLQHARSLIGSGSWSIRTLDDSSPDMGQYVDLIVDALGRMHIAYRDAAQRIVRYGYRNLSGQWILEDASISLLYDPTHISLQYSASQGLPVLAFRDLFRNSVIYAEKDSQAVWTMDTVVIGQSNFVGSPLELKLDAQDNRWLLYNYVTSSEEIRLLRRTPQGKTWNQVSVLNNQSQLAGTFNFHIVGNDFYVPGRKNKVNEWGIGILSAPGGASTSLDFPETEVLHWQLFPNPNEGLFTVAIDLVESRKLSISLISLQGRTVKTWLGNTSYPEGKHHMNLDARGLPGGMYFIQIRSHEKVWTQKIILH